MGMNTKKILYTAGIDIAFIFSFYGLLTFLASSLGKYSAKIQNILLTLQQSTDIQTSELAMDGMNGLLYRGIIYFVVGILAFYILYFLGKGTIYLVLSKKKANKKLIKKFALFSSVWSTIIILLNAFVILFLLLTQQIDDFLLRFGLIISFIFTSLAYFIIMNSNIAFIKKQNLYAIIDGFKSSFRLTNIKSLLIAIIIGIIFSYTWGSFAQNFSEGIKFNTLSIFYIILASWLRYDIFTKT